MYLDDAMKNLGEAFDFFMQNTLTKYKNIPIYLVNTFQL